AACDRVGNASAKPIPISTCGASVQATLEPGSRPSPASPPAVTTHPAAAEPRYRSRVRYAVARVASGIAETATAAASGEYPNPSTSSSTSRNRAPPPAACTHRAAIRNASVGARPHASDPAPNTTTPAANSTDAPIRRPISAAGTADNATVRLNAVITQATCSTVVENVARMSGR